MELTLPLDETTVRVCDRDRAANNETAPQLRRNSTRESGGAAESRWLRFPPFTFKLAQQQGRAGNFEASRVNQVPDSRNLLSLRV